ncbi:IucA/IucC family siderophore biosynthesis protein [Streptacidiphilus sp. N1-3]|uniref:IucA/IucC family siderophore biosynthesis protein n=1 Tax=Streptacidiphilus alkalitolerans TaxID=3342712 RepID=A0ABV6X8X1_9ACTN
MSVSEGRADDLAKTALLSCVVRELAVPDGEGLLLPATGQRLTVRPGRRPSRPELVDARGRSTALSLDGLVAVAASELRARTGTDNTTLAGEIADSRDVIAELLAARARLSPPDDLFLRSEQALVAGHRQHPAAKTRGGGPAGAWLPYAPEAYAAFPLTLLAVREDLLAGEGDSAVLDQLWGGRAPAGYRILPAHPWQLRLLDRHPALDAALGDGRLRVLGPTPEPAWATSSIRTVYLPGADLFLKFSLDVRITNDIRRLWLRDLRWLVPVDEVLAKSFGDAPGAAAMLADHGYRTAAVGGVDGYEAFAVLVRAGFGGAEDPPLLAAGLSEGFPGSPLDRLADDASALRWWRRYVEQVVPPVLHAYLRHGVVLECHLQNVLVGMDAEGFPDRAVFRDHEGVKLLRQWHGELLGSLGPDVPTPGLSAVDGWKRLVYCLVTNHLLEIAGAVAERRPGTAAALWPLARPVFAAYADHQEVADLLAAPTVPAKTNLLLRWTGADGGDSAYTPLPNPLAR